MASFAGTNADDAEAMPARRSFRNDRTDQISYLPSSPTDKLLSPLTKRLWGPKRMHSPDMSKELKKNMTSLDFYVLPTPFPYQDVGFILGTSSLNRKQIVDRLGWKYVQMSPDIDEKATRDPDPLEMPLLISQGKAQALLARLDQANDQSPKLLLTSDQIVLFGREVREKPTDRDEALAFLRSYSDKSVCTVSAVTITHYPSRKQRSAIDIATVYWEPIPEATVQRVVDKGGVFSCAGGFMVEDPDLCTLVKSIDGGMDSVMGLPVNLMFGLMEEVMEEVSGGIDGEDVLMNSL
eukprot:gene29420-35511_t